MKSTVLAAVMASVAALGGCRDWTSASCDAPITSADGPLLEIKFVDQLRIRGCSRARLHSETGALLLGLQATLGQARVVKLEPMISGNLAAPEMLSWHMLALVPGTDTSAAIAALRARPEVQYVYSHSTVIPPPPARSH